MAIARTTPLIMVAAIAELQKFGRDYSQVIGKLSLQAKSAKVNRYTYVLSGEATMQSS